MAYYICTSLLVSLVILVIGIVFKIYLKLTTGWCRSATCLVGKTAIVTGANTGIGYDTALDFAKRGARVILACRDETKAIAARNLIIKETGNENVVVKIIDMSSFKSVRNFAKDIDATENHLDILVNNAGAGGIGDEKSEDGHVLLMQINYYSSFLLTILLIGLLKKSAPSRIINVSSIGAKRAKLDVDSLETFPGRFMVYFNSKLGNILFTQELAKKLHGTGVTTYSLHPGAVITEIFRHSKGITRFLIVSIANLFFKTSEEGAQTTIYTAVAKGIENYNGEHFDDCKRVPPYKSATDPGLAKKLWEKTEEIVQLKPEELKF